MIVLGHARSINVRKVLWLGRELGVDLTLEAWGGDSGRPVDSAEFRALNPNRQVPVLRDGETLLWESNTICRYLAVQAGREDLLPSPPADRARVEQWMDWQATDLNSAWRGAFMGLVRQSSAYADPALITASRSAWNDCMAILDAQLQRSGGHAAGPGFTLADIVLGLSTHRWYSTPMDRPDLPAVADYYRRLSMRPGFQAHGLAAGP